MDANEGTQSERANWITQHPVYRDLMALDEGDCAQVYAAFVVYLDLTEARGWTNVVGVRCPEVQAVLLEGCEKEGTAAQVVYPIPIHRSVNHRQVRSILTRRGSMILCAVASDSTLIYQWLNEGLVIQDPPEDIQDMQRRQNRKRKYRT